MRYLRIHLLCSWRDIFIASGCRHQSIVEPVGHVEELECNRVPGVGPGTLRAGSATLHQTVCVTGPQRAHPARVKTLLRTMRFRGVSKTLPLRTSLPPIRSVGPGCPVQAPCQTPGHTFDVAEDEGGGALGDAPVELLPAVPPAHLQPQHGQEHDGHGPHHHDDEGHHLDRC